MVCRMTQKHRGDIFQLQEEIYVSLNMTALRSHILTNRFNPCVSPRSLWLISRKSWMKVVWTVQTGILNQLSFQQIQVDIFLRASANLWPPPSFFLPWTIFSFCQQASLKATTYLTKIARVCHYRVFVSCAEGANPNHLTSRPYVCLIWFTFVPWSKFLPRPHSFAFAEMF